MSKVLITGITGYIGFQTLVIALERGLHVRGVVRHDSNISELKSQNAIIAQCHENGQLDFVVVSDFVAKGAFDKVLDGVTAIIHLASPLAVQSDDFEADIINPAVSMVSSVLESAARVASVKRVVITSSSVTLIPFEWNLNPDSERLYTADDINDSPKRPFSNSMEAYWASKALARIKTKEFVTHEKPQFDYVNLLPSVVIGPDQRISKGSESLLKGTRAAVLAPALTSSLNSSFPYVGVPVHVADVARAHVDAVDKSRIPGNSEYILSSNTPEGVEWNRDIRHICEKYFPDQVRSGVLPLQGSLSAIKWRLNGATTESVFGWQFTSFEETMRQLISQYLHLKSRE